MLDKLTKTQAWTILGLIWLVSNLCDRLWLILDRSVPAWDQSNHLTNSLHYLHSLQSSQFLNGEWWRSFWMISTKYPPLTYINAAIFQQIFGRGNDGALLTNLLYSAVLLISVYTIGKTLFNPQIGLWAAGLTMLLPRLYQTRLQFLLDTPSMTLTVACFCCLTVWRSQKTERRQWLWAFIFGIVWGLALLTKQSVMFFLIVPLLWLVLSHLSQRHWQRITQLVFSFLISIPIWFPWYRTNWIYLFSTAQNSNAIPAAYEGDPAVNTLAAWTYYWKDLPLAISWVLLIVPLVGLLLHLLGRFPRIKDNNHSPIQGLVWLGIYCLGAYIICSAIYNKDTRYIMPYLPVLAIFLAYCLTLWRGKWKTIRWITVGVAFFVMCANLFPIAGTDKLTLALSPGVLFRPYLGQEIPNAELIETVREIAPYQKTTLGVIVNTDTVNHNTLNYFGALANNQIYGRELGTKAEEVEQDGRSLDWFVTKTGENGFARDTQLALANQLEKDVQFKLIKNWQLPDDSILKLFKRKIPTVAVQPLSQMRERVQLDRVIVPDKIPPGFPVPITYEWSGSGKQLKSGLVLLTWQSQNHLEKEAFWIHDRGIGMGMLHENLSSNSAFKVIENTAMLPARNLPPGEYQLSAIYLNRETGESYPISVPNVTITLDPAALPVSAPVLDLVTQLRQLSLNLAQGVDGLDPIFEQVDRLNQYDPLQDYLKQAQFTLNYRLKHNLGNHKLDWTYGLALSQALQEDAQGAIATLKQLIQLDPNNPYHHAYLAFVYLYNWQPKAAETALKPALQLAPHIEEIKALDGIAAVMQGNFIKGWKILQLIVNS